MSLCSEEHKEFQCSWRLEFKGGVGLNEPEQQGHETTLY